MTKNTEQNAKHKKNTLAHDEASKPVRPDYSLKLLIVVVEHGYAEDIVEILNKNNVFFEIIFHGKGTASSQLLGLLGLDGDEKEIIMSLVEPQKSDALIESIYEEYRATGIALTVRLNSIGGMKIIKLLKGESDENRQQ